ncbi:MAG TPA: universal stress protein [Ilumatobacteraceae bacterium]
MTARWIVGVDGSQGSRHALEWTVAQAAGRDVNVDAVSAWSVPLTGAEIGMPGVLTDWDEVRTSVAERLDKVLSELERDGVDVRPVVIQGGAVSALLDESAKAQLLVLGSRGLNAMKRLTLGSVSRHLATHARVPTVVVPGEAPTNAAQRMIVGVDGSANSAAAFRWALDFAGTGAEVEVVAAITVSPWLDPDTTRARFATEIELEERHISSVLDEVDPDHRATRRVELQDARVAIAEAADQADLVVIGSSGRSRIGEMLLGSTASWLVQHATRATVVIPPAGR